MKPALFERLGDDFVTAFGAPVILSGDFGHRTVTAIYRAFRESDAGAGDYPGVETPRFILSGRARDFCDLRQDDFITVNGKTHVITGVTDDARAMRKLFLSDVTDARP